MSASENFNKRSSTTDFLSYPVDKQTNTQKVKRNIFGGCNNTKLLNIIKVYKRLQLDNDADADCVAQDCFHGLVFDTVFH